MRGLLLGLLLANVIYFGWSFLSWPVLGRAMGPGSAQPGSSNEEVGISLLSETDPELLREYPTAARAPATD